MKLTLLLLILCFCLGSILADPIKTPRQEIVTAAQVNGTWRSGRNEFRIWALGKQKLRVEFSGSYLYQSPHGKMVNIGECAGTAMIDATTATFKPDEVTEPECKITMKFLKGKLEVAQEGQCDFGHNVSAAGTYRKASGQKPKFTAKGK